MTDVNDPNLPTGEQEGGSQEQSSGNLTFTKDDLDKVMKENYHGRQHIQTIESENKTLRAELDQLKQQVSESQSLREMVEELRGTTYSTDESTGPTAPQFDENDILAKMEQRVFDALSQREQQAALEKNWSDVTTKLRDQHGEKFESYVAERARTLGMSEDQLVQMGATTPEAFMALMGQQQRNSAAPTLSSERAPIGDSSVEAEMEFARIAKLQKDLTTEEGRKAREMWNDKEWQKRQRERILAGK